MDAEAELMAQSSRYIEDDLFGPVRESPQYQLLQETFLEDYFVEFDGIASARWSIEYDERNPDSHRVYAYPKLHYVEVNTPHRIIQIGYDEIHAKTRAAIQGILEDELECMG